LIRKHINDLGNPYPIGKRRRERKLARLFTWIGEEPEDDDGARRSGMKWTVFEEVEIDSATVYKPEDVVV
ncbi:hypothetical protein LINPERHAP1_LOCUS6006, partial [Linum perenne]